MPDSVLYRVGLSLAVAGRPGARRRAVIEPDLEPLPAGWEDAAQAEMEAAQKDLDALYARWAELEEKAGDLSRSHSR